MSGRPTRFAAISDLRLTGFGHPEEALSRHGRAIATALDQIDQDPDFRLSLGHLASIERLLNSRTGVVKRLCQALRSGRVEVGAGWVCLDQRLTGGEALVRNLTTGLRFADSVLGVRPCASHESCPGGWTPQWPQLAAGCGLTGVVFTGPGPIGPGVYDWEGLDGSRLAVWHTGETGRLLRTVCDPAPNEDPRAAQAVLDGLLPGVPVGLGDTLWVATSEAMARLAEWAEVNGAPLTTATVREVLEEIGRADHNPIAGAIPASCPPWDTLTSAHNQSRRATAALLDAEQALAWSDVAGIAAPPTTAFETRWRSLLAASSVYASGTGEAAGLAWISDTCHAVESGSRSDLSAVCQALAEHVPAGYGPSGTIPVVVYNTQAWDRTGPVRIHAALYGDTVAADVSRYETYRLEDDQGRPVASQELSGRQTTISEVDLLFVAADVPGHGYRTYYLVPQTSESDAFVGIQAPGAVAPEFPEPAFVVTDVEDRVSRPFGGIRTGRRFSSAHYDLDVDEVTGRVGVFDKRLGRDLVRDIRLEAAEESMDAGPDGRSPTGRIHELAPELVELEESGEVCATVKVSGRLLSSEAAIRYQFYEAVPWVDVSLSLCWTDEAPARVRMVFPVCAHDARLRYGVPFGQVEAGSGDHAPLSPGQSRQCDGWVCFDSDDWGVAVATDRVTFTTDGSELQSEVLLSCPDPGSYGYKRIWRRYPESVRARYRIRGYAGGFGDGLPHRDGWEASHPFHAACSYGPPDGGKLPSRLSLIGLQAPGLVTTALKRSEDGTAVVMRAFETLGRPCVARMTSHRPIASVREADLLELPGDGLDPEAIRFKPWEIKTLVVELETAA